MARSPRGCGRFIQVPLRPRLALAFGIGPIHLDIIPLANLELIHLTEPTCLNLLLSPYRFYRPILVALRSLSPIVVMSIGVVLITYLLFLTAALPDWHMRPQGIPWLGFSG
jgi:TRAP-type C4-dicarboxylate transport system permease large subunit